jgi:enoyl-CoA hydratase
VPQAIALEMLLTGEPLSAQRAADVGLVNRLSPEGGAVDVAVELAETVATNGPLAVAISKQVARSTFDWSVQEGWKAQSELISPVFLSEDAREGATAFAEKRAPVWKGR